MIDPALTRSGPAPREEAVRELIFAPSVNVSAPATRSAISPLPWALPANEAATTPVSVPLLASSVIVPASIDIEAVGMSDPAVTASSPPSRSDSVPSAWTRSRPPGASNNERSMVMAPPASSSVLPGCISSGASRQVMAAAACAPTKPKLSGAATLKPLAPPRVSQTKPSAKRSCGAVDRCKPAGTSMLPPGPSVMPLGLMK